MSALQGGLPKAANASVDDFIAEFIDHIAPDEWRALAMLPRIHRPTQLVNIVIWVRSLPAYPLPPEHPLNPASRYEVSA